VAEQEQHAARLSGVVEGYFRERGFDPALRKCSAEIEPPKLERTSIVDPLGALRKAVVEYAGVAREQPPNAWEPKGAKTDSRDACDAPQARRIDRVHPLPQELSFGTRRKPGDLRTEPEGEQSLPEPAIGETKDVSPRCEAVAAEDAPRRPPPWMGLTLQQHHAHPGVSEPQRHLEARQARSDHHDAPGLHRTSSEGTVAEQGS
jgi:hypothetical protein